MHSLNFLTNQFDLNTAYITYYDNLLAVLSYVIAYLSAHTGWSMASRYRAETGKGKKWLWVCGGGAVMGCGVWAMHFVAMLAYRLPIAVHYDLSITILSVLPAMMASIVAIAVIGQQQLTVSHYALGSLLFGSGVAAMHYTGMAAVQMNAVMVYDPTLFSISILVAIALAFISLKVKSFTTQFISHQHYRLIKNGSIALMGAAISGMHYTGMAAVYFFPVAQTAVVINGENHTHLSVIVGIISITMMLLTISMTAFEQRFKNAIVMAHTSRERMFEAIDSISDGFVMFDENDKLILFNDNFKKMYQEIAESIKPGISYREFIEKRFEYAEDTHQLIDDDNDTYIQRRLKWHNTPQGHFSETLSDGRHVFGKEQRAVSGDSVGIWTDISELKKAKDRLIQANKQIQILLDASSAPIVVRVIENDRILYFNDSAKQYFSKNNFDISLGSTKTFISSKQLEELKAQIKTQGSANNIELRLYANDNRQHPVILSATGINYDDEPSLLFSFVDISERKKMEQQLTTLAQTDPLTGVCNRRHLKEMGAKEVIRCQRNKQPLCLLVIDIDDIKVINDRYGHEAGDRTIMKTTEIAAELIRDVDTLGRLGGEEFAVILPDTDQHHAKRIAERIRSSLETQQMSEHRQLYSFTVSIGISLVLTKETDSIEKMLNRADQKLYQAKENGKNQVVF